MAEAAGREGGGCKQVLGQFLEYDTPKIVHIGSKKVGLIFRSLQLLIIAYIAGYVIAYRKGYQDFDSVESASTSKLKGVALTNYTALNMTGPGGNPIRVWDVADYVIPPQENDAFFVMTNVIFTPNQTQGVCSEDALIPDSICKGPEDCEEGYHIPNGNGVNTGECVNSESNPQIKTCQIRAWCPVEVDAPPVKGFALLEESQNFTVLIKNNVAFNKFNQKSRNILDSQNASYLQRCHFDASDPVDRYCPVFVMGDIVSLAGVASYNDIAVLGGVIVIHIHWDCNLDFSISKCLPQYSFQRLDQEDVKIAKGTNFRYASFYERNGEMTRDLFKAYGIRVIIKVTGQAGKFSVIPLLLNIGSGIGLLAIATLISDFILCYVLKKRSFYYLKKYFFVADVSDEDDERLLNPGEEDSASAN